MQELESLRDPEDRDRLVYVLEFSMDMQKLSQFFVGRKVRCKACCRTRS